MTSQPLYVAFVWHMHQPFYKDLVTGEYVLPWVRLHAIKDYYDMVAILDKFPQVKQTFNLVPSLLEQIREYESGAAEDKHLKVSISDPRDLIYEDKVFMLQNFFMANWDTMVYPYKRYQELLLKRGRFVTIDDIKSVAKRFTEQELMDLQVWFNLTWFGYIYRSGDPVVKALLEKGRDFTAEEKKALLIKQKEIIAKVIPKYREMMQKGQIEISVTPYYHPILPLVIDTNSAKEALPSVAMPAQRFRHPEDAKYQIESAVNYAKELFGQAPKGMWPSEGSVSEEIIPLISAAGIKWIATDEEILALSFGRSLSEGRALASYELFKPYQLKRDNGDLSIIFRDHSLSDLIGFVYSKWQPVDAANDFMGHLNNIRNSLPDDGKKYVVSVILDGENAWEYYRNNGWDFFNELYSRLSNDPNIKTTTVSAYLEQNPATDRLHRLFSGSWINHNFRIWIGHEEDNKAWDYLTKARLALHSAHVIDPKAWQELYIAEGSDWFWWYGDDHSSENDETFDQLFRKHLKNIYHLILKPSPQYLDVPIKQIRAIKPTREPASLLTPMLDGEITNYYEWLPAGQYDIGRLKGTMHQAETVIKSIFYGFDVNNMHLRLDLNIDMNMPELKQLSFGAIIIHPYPFKIKAVFDKQQNKYVMNIYKPVDDSWDLCKTLGLAGVKDIVELSVPFADIGAKANDEMQFMVIVEKDTQELERWPRGGSINFKVPPADYMEKQWTV